MKKEYTIGTRGSLLALTQCNLIKNDIESQSDLKFHLKEMKTLGDQITDKPLWQLDGKDFFTKELDQALINKEIDLVVHSYKDLGSERPSAIKLACITRRFFAHDILLIKKSTISNLNKMKTLNIGTSSPRRIHNITNSLKDNLPTKNIEVKCSTLRGNVNTRIEKLLNNQHDAIVLALAGLERLASSEKSRAILEELTKDLDFLVLPQKSFPSSASQGALAIETHREADAKLTKALANVHHRNSSEEIKRERKAFNEYGGGCHLAVGVHVKKIDNLFVHIHRGTTGKQDINTLELEGVNYNKYLNKKIYNVMGKNDFLLKRVPLTRTKSNNENLYVTSKHCLHAIDKFNSIWSSGSSTRKKILEMGIWVNGCADGFGHKEIEKLKSSKAIQLLLNANNKWQVLSHENALSEVGEVLGAYKHEVNDILDLPDQNLEEYDILYWNSYTQYKNYISKFPSLKKKLHSCGIGKSREQFIKNKIDIIPALSFEYLQKKVNPNE